MLGPGWAYCGVCGIGVCDCAADCGAGRGGNGCADSDCAGAVSESFDGFMSFMVMMLSLTVITG